ncbi:Rieske (2Fe-2S) protein [Actinopolymorpha sp. B11F2]|uniref:Rieske (2Fe-2S) protein n=1 Tax=Actinopolymorpha sp. B11F2 TaxID=3160862 RepID=UPI0032E4B598
MPSYVVATVDEIPPGARKIVTVARRSIGVFNVDGAYYALRNQCPHEGGPLCEGVLSGLVRSPRPGTYDYLRRGEILRCPWHGWEFDVMTGQSWFDPAKTRVQSYDATVETHESLAGYAKGPYEAETYRVEVDREYVVLHL